MGCATCREAVSAILDGEPPGVRGRSVDAHLDGCAACRAWAEAAAEVTRRARLVAAPRVPDVTAAVLGRLPAASRGRRPGLGRRTGLDAVLRLALLAVGAGQLAVSLPAFSGGTSPMAAPVHLAHETGAWNLGLAACFLVVAGLPRLAAGALPFLLTFIAVLSWVTLRDLAAGHVDVDRAVGHLLLVAGALLVTVLAVRTRPRRTGPARRRLPSPGAWWTAVRPRAGGGPATTGRQLQAAVPPVLRAETGAEQRAA